MSKFHINRRLDIMTSLLDSRHQKKQLSPKLIWLEPEHFEEAQKISGCNLDEVRQWKVYLNALGLLGFEQWVTETIPDINIHRVNCSIKDDSNSISDVFGFLKLGDFHLCLITVDKLIDDYLTIPIEFINSPELAAHFYVLLEVLEEEEKLNVYGFMRHDKIVKYCQSSNLKNQANDSYILLLNWFDNELNNLLLSARFLEVTAIPLPSKEGAKMLVKLSDWFRGVFTEGWQSTEIIWQMLPINLDLGFARSVNKSNSYEISGTKLFDFGILLNGESFALIVNQKTEVNNEQDILVQILPTNQQYLPLGLELKVTLNPNIPESQSQAVTARNADNAIQLEFLESSGKQFKVEVSFNDAFVIEEFLL
ncbi:DUF1822 family protein [Nodularia spumigena]|nr:DUF1822 family protein [Nodularia spumigena]